MISRFHDLCNLANKYNIKLIVALLTGWMSGALFVPPALFDKNLFNNQESLYLETLFLRGFVNEFKDESAIIAWEPGNECNCMSPAVDSVTSWNWINMVVSTIKQSDSSRPVYSGMHGSRIDYTRPWNQQILGELTDGLTTHPYPLFTPNCGKSALNTLPANYHAIAESIYYQGGSRKLCFIEEIGSFGPAYMDAKRTEDYLYTVLYSAYAHGIPGVLWWCAFAFDRCNEQYPYRWVAMERDLGAFDSYRNPGGGAKAMKKFLNEIKELPYGNLPKRKVDCLVVATLNENMWQAAYGAFILSTQAGFSIEYCDILSQDSLPESNFYIVPCITGFSVMPIDKYQQILKAAANGATVCFTAANGMLQPFVDEFGFNVKYIAEVPSQNYFRINDIADEFCIPSTITRVLNSNTCETLGSDKEGNPVLVCKKYGKGKLVYLNVPLENNAITQECKLYKIYQKFAEIAGVECLDKSPEIGITRHFYPDGKEVRILINYADYQVEDMPGNSVKIERF